MNNKSGLALTARVMTLREVSAVLRIGRVTALRLVRSGQLRAFRAGKVWRIRREDLEQFMQPRIAVEGERAKIIAAFGRDDGRRR